MTCLFPIGRLYGLQGLGFIGDSVRIEADDLGVESSKTLNFHPLKNCSTGNLSGQFIPNVTALVRPSL